MVPPSPTHRLDLEAGPSDAGQAIAVMHRAFEQFSATGKPSGALLETAASLREEMASGTRLGLMRLDGAAVASVKHHPAADGTLYFSRLAVDPAQRGRGLAGLLVRALRKRALTEGLSGLSCAVRAEEETNIAIYEHLGMEVVAHETRGSLTGAVIDVVLIRDRMA